MICLPSYCPPPSKGNITEETMRALDEAFPVAAQMFDMSDAWSLGPTRMMWEEWNGYSSHCRYLDGKRCLWFGFVYLLEDMIPDVATEYGIYRNDGVIGQIRTSDWRVHVRKTVVHELAHAVQYGLPFSESSLHLGRRFYEGLGTFDFGHGPFFQEIYARLRKELVNPLVPKESIGVPGAMTRLKKEPDLSEVPHPLVGKVIEHPKHGRLEAVLVKKSEVHALGGIRDDITPVPIGRFRKLLSEQS